MQDIGFHGTKVNYVEDGGKEWRRKVSQRWEEEQERVLGAEQQ